jgi:hypothetical protein
MKSKKSKPKRKLAAPNELDIHDRVKLHIKTTARLHALIAQCTSLRDAGKLAAARELFVECERLKDLLVELETVNRHPHNR